MTLQIKAYAIVRKDGTLRTLEGRNAPALYVTQKSAADFKLDGERVVPAKVTVEVNV